MPLVLNSSSISGLSAGGLYVPGHVMQVVSGTYSSTLSTNSNSFTDLISLSITPLSTSSKILVSVHLYASGYGAPKILRDATAIVSPAQNYALYFRISAGGDDTIPYQSSYRVMYPFDVYDSPSITSAITYKLQVQAHSGSSYLVINPDTSNNYNTTSPAQSLTRMTLMEIAG